MAREGAFLRFRGRNTPDPGQTGALRYDGDVQAPRLAVMPALLGIISAILVVALVPALLQQPVVGAGILGAIFLVAVGAASPRIGVSIWLALLVFIPFWTTVSNFGITVNTALLAMPVAVGIVLRKLGPIALGQAKLDIRRTDILVVSGVALVLILGAVYGQASFLATNVGFTLFGGYVIGRLAPAELRSVYAVFMIIIAIWGIAEWIFRWHAFVNWLPEVGGIGPFIQERGGLARSEATLGHAIAYGACLAAAIPLVRNFRGAFIWQALLVVGVLASVSRGPIIATVFAFALIAWTTTSGRVRFWSAIVLVAGLIGVYFFFTFLYEGAGQSDVTLSEQARDSQIGQTLSYINLFGPATGAQLTPEGLYIVNGIERVDSTWLRLGLDFGWVVTALLLIPLVVTSWRVLTRRAGPAAIALTTQIPIIVVTSFITQWQTVFFFLAGLAISEGAIRRRPAPVETPEPGKARLRR